MEGKPKITIKDFSGMGDNGSFWIEGFDVQKDGGQSILSPGFKSALLTSSTTMSGLESITGFCQFISNGGFSGNMVLGIGGTTPLIFGLNAAGYTHKGKLYTSQISGTSYFPDVLKTKNGNILFATRNYVGIGYYGTATGGSATTLVDTANNFATLGFSASAGYNKIYNLTKSEARTITSVATTTLNFASGTTYASGDKYLAFNEGKFTFTTTAQYSGQVDASDFRRQMIDFNDAYYILNGNYLAKINSDEVTFDENHKALPSRHQAWCMDSNQDKLLVGCEIDGRGRLLLWDGYASGWISSIEIDKPIIAITNYKSGFAYLSGSSIYYTDGYSIQLIAKIPGSTERYSIYGSFSSLLVVGDDFFISGIVEDNNRILSGMYRYNVNTGWYYVPTAFGTDKYSYSARTSALFYSTDIINQMDSYPAILYSSINPLDYSINKLYTTSAPRAIRLYIKLPQKINVSLVELNIGGSTSRSSTLTTSNIYINYGEGKSPYRTYIQTSSPTTTTSFKDGGYTYDKNIGDLLIFTDKNISGQRAYITNITDKGTSNQVITYSPATTSAPENSASVLCYGLKSAGSMSIDETNMPKELFFRIPSFYSDKLFLEVYIDGTAGFDIHSINIY